MKKEMRVQCNSCVESFRVAGVSLCLVDLVCEDAYQNSKIRTIEIK